MIKSIWTEAVVVYFKVLSQHLPGRTAENLFVFRIVSVPNHLDYKARVLIVATPAVQRGNLCLSEMSDSQVVCVCV